MKTIGQTSRSRGGGKKRIRPKQEVRPDQVIPFDDDEDFKDF